MDEPPQPEYKVVERDGQLVVEKTGQSRKAGDANARPPKVPTMRFDWIKLGQALFARLHSFDLTEDGHAVVTVSQLENSIKLAARPYDLYYLTPRQQAIIGFIAVVRRWGILMLLPTLFVFTFIFDASPFWLMLMMAMAALPLTTYFKDEYEAIHQQVYEPPAAQAC